MELEEPGSLTLDSIAKIMSSKQYGTFKKRDKHIK